MGKFHLLNIMWYAQEKLLYYMDHEVRYCVVLFYYCVVLFYYE